MILLNNTFSENALPISTKFHADPTVETGSRVCSNCNAPMTAMHIYGKQLNNNITPYYSSKQKTANRFAIIPFQARIWIGSTKVC